MYFVGFLLGAVCGYTIVKPIPLMPVWIGVLAGGGTSLVMATGENKVGDLARMVDMKLLFIVGIIKNLEREVYLIRKFMTVASNVLALLVFWDKYFGIREKGEGGRGAKDGAKRQQSITPSSYITPPSCITNSLPLVASLIAVGAVTGVVGGFLSATYGKVSGDIEGEMEDNLSGVKEGVEGLAKVAESML